ncbi:MAG: dTDP-glucose 4,6-dehydratase 2 [Chlamydiae bacterium]|nr:dTDP-glucose 4,6-dehydratase 2 [Chlamydiota bacterium]
MLKKRPNKRLLVTGGAGFIGSAFIRTILSLPEGPELVVNLDALTYAADLTKLKSVESDQRYTFAAGDICNGALIEELVRRHQIDTIVHFAAETHVDRSIDAPRLFARTNIEGTLSLLEVTRRFPAIHFHHVSTDEVYGSYASGHASEESPYAPNSPYAASKAAADHLTRAYHRTYNLSVTLSQGSNTYGLGQHPEKFLPYMLERAMQGKPLPIYGKGINVRDWLAVEDHVAAIWQILERGTNGESYSIGGGQQRQNLELLEELFVILSRYTEKSPEYYRSLIEFVEDRPGHDLRYALNTEKIKRELGWTPTLSLAEGIEKLVLSKTGLVGVL